jgi:hypothetical protein
MFTTVGWQFSAGKDKRADDFSPALRLRIVDGSRLLIFSMRNTKRCTKFFALLNAES